MPITGIAQHNQVLRLYRSSEAAEAGEAPVAALTDERATLAAYGLQEFYCIKVRARPGQAAGGSYGCSLTRTGRQHGPQRPARRVLRPCRRGQV